MPKKNVQIDFVGMCLLIEDTSAGALTVGLINEPRHLHIMTYPTELASTGPSPTGITTTVRPLFNGWIYTLTGCAGGTPTVRDQLADLADLPDLAEFGPVNAQAAVLSNMAVQIQLP